MICAVCVGPLIRVTILARVTPGEQGGLHRNMSKSVKRVARALEEGGIATEILEMQDGTRTAEAAAAAMGCTQVQIAKSIIFVDTLSAEAVLFITAGGNRVDTGKASALAGGPLGKADATLIRAQTGFVIGGVSPIGHLNPIRAWFDPRLTDFEIVYAAAGTPRHLFSIAPKDLLHLSGALRADFTA